MCVVSNDLRRYTANIRFAASLPADDAPPNRPPAGAASFLSPAAAGAGPPKLNAGGLDAASAEAVAGAPKLKPLLEDSLDVFVAAVEVPPNKPPGAGAFEGSVADGAPKLNPPATGAAAVLPSPVADGAEKPKPPPPVAPADDDPELPVVPKLNILSSPFFLFSSPLSSQPKPRPAHVFFDRLCFDFRLPFLNVSCISPNTGPSPSTFFLPLLGVTEDCPLAGYAPESGVHSHKGAHQTGIGLTGEGPVQLLTALSYIYIIYIYLLHTYTYTLLHSYHSLTLTSVAIIWLVGELVMSLRQV